MQVTVRTDQGERCVELCLCATVAEAKAAVLQQCAPRGSQRGSQRGGGPGGGHGGQPGAQPGGGPGAQPGSQPGGGPGGQPGSQPGQPCPASAVWMKFDGRPLPDDETLGSAGVRAGACLSLHVRARGGGLNYAWQTSEVQNSFGHDAREQAAFMFASMDKERVSKLELHDVILYLGDHYQHLFIHKGGSHKWHVDEKKLKNFVSLLHDSAEDGLVSRAAFVKAYWAWCQKTHPTCPAVPGADDVEDDHKANTDAGTQLLFPLRRLRVLVCCLQSCRVLPSILPCSAFNLVAWS